MKFEPDDLAPYDIGDEFLLDIAAINTLFAQTLRTGLAICRKILVNQLAGGFTASLGKGRVKRSGGIQFQNFVNQHLGCILFDLGAIFHGIFQIRYHA